jgi:hypothetical protein
MRDYSWIAELSLEAKNNSASLGAYFAKAISKVHFAPVSDREMKHSWAVLVRDLVRYSFDPDSELPPDIQSTIGALQTMAIDKYNQDMLEEAQLTPVMTKFFEQIFETMGQHPKLFDLIEDADLIEDILSTLAKKYVPIIRLFPAFSHEALSIVPYLREPLFTALYELPEMEHYKLETD